MNSPFSRRLCVHGELWRPISSPHESSSPHRPPSLLGLHLEPPPSAVSPTLPGGPGGFCAPALSPPPFLRKRSWTGVERVEDAKQSRVLSCPSSFDVILFCVLASALWWSVALVVSLVSWRTRGCVWVCVARGLERKGRGEAGTLQRAHICVSRWMGKM